MPETAVQAIVLRRRNAGESDRRLTVLTLELGKIDVIAKGARKAASRLSGSTEPLSLASMNLASGRQNWFVTQSQPLTTHRGVRADYDRLNMGLALAELYAAVLPFEQPDPDAFALLRASLQALEDAAKPISALVWAEVRLLDVSGFMPELDSCVVTGAAPSGGEVELSPSAGGYIGPAAASRFGDRFKVRAEVLYGLARIGALPDAPANLKFAFECLAALLPFWRHIADMPLPANESVLRELHP